MHIDHDHVGTPHHHDHDHDHEHDHGAPCAQDCTACGEGCTHTPMEELVALMKYMVGHNASHTNELANLAKELDKAGEHAAYEQVMQAVSDYEKGNLRLSAILSSLTSK